MITVEESANSSPSLSHAGAMDLQWPHLTRAGGWRGGVCQNGVDVREGGGGRTEGLEVTVG